MGWAMVRMCRLCRKRGKRWHIAFQFDLAEPIAAGTVTQAVGVNGDVGHALVLSRMCVDAYRSLPAGRQAAT